MAFEFLGPALSAGANILGGIFGSQSSSANREASQQMAAANIAAQREFATKGIQWRVEDAQRAGIHPLYALGAQTHSFSPVSVGSGLDNSLGEGIARAGQDLGRAFSAGATNEERVLQLAGAKLDLETKGLQNDVLRAELASKVQRLTGAMVGAPIPSSSDPWFPLPQSDPRRSSLPGEGHVSIRKIAEKGTGGYIAGTTAQPAPGWSDIQDWAEQRYGDEGIPTKFLANLVAGADLWHNIGRPGIAAIQSRLGDLFFSRIRRR